MRAGVARHVTLNPLAAGVFTAQPCPPPVILEMKQSKPPPRWPSDVEYLGQSCFDPKFPKGLRSLVIGPVPQASSSHTSGRVPVAIRVIDDPHHPAFGQRGLFASAKISPNSYIVSYHGELHCDARGESDYDLSLHRVDGISIGVDASQKGNEARFVNDFRGIQPKPNAAFRQGTDHRGWLEMSVWSGPIPIKRGEEILVSYGKGWWKARQALEETDEGAEIQNAES